MNGLVVVSCSSSLLIREPQLCPLSGRDSTYRTVRNCGATSVETFLRNLHRDLPCQVEWIKKEVEDHGWMNYKRHVTPWFKRNGWVNKRGGQRLTAVLAKVQDSDMAMAKRKGEIIIPKGKFWWVPARGKGYKWHKDDGGWLKWTGQGGWEKIGSGSRLQRQIAYALFATTCLSRRDGSHRAFIGGTMNQLGSFIMRAQKV